MNWRLRLRLWREWPKAVWIKYAYTKKCDGLCGEPLYHEVHFTWLGRRRYLGKKS